MPAFAPRSMLFVPANDALRAPKALHSGADAVIFDLEDAVADAEKVGARAKALEMLSLPRNCCAYVRVNAVATRFCFEDLMAVVCPELDGVMLPMVESPADLATVDWLLKQLEHRNGMAEGTVDLLPIIESAAGLMNIAAIVAAPTRVRRVCFGAGDFTLDIGMTWTPGEDELLLARAQIVAASRAAGLKAPIDSVYLWTKDAAGMDAAARRSLALGFAGKLCIHPSQVRAVNQHCAPSEAERTQALRIVEAFDRAEAAGVAAIMVDGALVDYPIAEKARRLLARGTSRSEQGLPGDA